MSDVQFKLEGVEELSATIRQVNYDVKRKSGRFALRKAAKLVAEAVKKEAQRLDDPATARKITDNVAVRFSTRRFKRTGDLMFRVGIKHGAKLSKGGDLNVNAPTPHWRLLEFGTQKMPARPFVRPALERNVGAATTEFMTHFKKALDRAIKRANKARRK